MTDTKVIKRVVPGQYLWHSNVFLWMCMFWYCQCAFVWARASLGGFYNCMRWCVVVMVYMAAIGQLSAHCFITWAGVKLMIWVVQVYSCSLMNLKYIHYGHGLHLVRCQTVTFLIKPILHTHRCVHPHVYALKLALRIRLVFGYWLDLLEMSPPWSVRTSRGNSIRSKLHYSRLFCRKAWNIL